MSIFKSKETNNKSGQPQIQICVEGGNGAVVASTFAHLTDDGGVELDLIQTNPPACGQGIGGALLNEVKTWGKEHGAQVLSGKLPPSDPIGVYPI